MTPLTIHILVKNNKDQIEQTLESLKELNCEILVGDLGSTDGTIDICRTHGCGIFQAAFPKDVARNKLFEASNTDWQFYLEPGEVLSSGHNLLAYLDGKPKRIYVVQDKVITKELRVCKKTDCKFVNPIFECLQPDEDVEQISVFIAGADQGNYLTELLSWKAQSPQSAEVDYYLSCQYLMMKDYKKFISHADYFLFKEGNPTFSTIMTRYYLAQIHLHVNSDVHESIRNILYCLCNKPLMAEYWCVLGDCYYKAGVPEKAVEFYKMAVEMGKSRLTDDPFPIELSKYNVYPENMIDLCNQIRKALPYH